MSNNDFVTVALKRYSIEIQNGRANTSKRTDNYFKPIDILSL
jgi:hypothetical protein